MVKIGYRNSKFLFYNRDYLDMNMRNAVCESLILLDSICVCMSATAVWMTLEYVYHIEHSSF